MRVAAGRAIVFFCALAVASSLQSSTLRGLSRPLALPLRPKSQASTWGQARKVRSDQLVLLAGSNDTAKAIGAAVLLAAILGASILPAIQTATVMSKVEVVRNEESGTNEIQMKPKFARLSPLSINKKLSQIPVFYVADSSTGEPIIGAGNEGKFYLDPTDAEKVMSSTGKGKLAVATLDEVYYPLITKRGVFGYKSPILDKAAADMRYTIVGNAEAIAKAKEYGYEATDATSVPIFQAEKLAFQSQDGRGVIVPVFLSEKDLQESWERLRGRSSSVASKPSVTANSLSEVLSAMEGGAQDYTKLEFFPDLPALERARDMLQ